MPSFQSPGNVLATITREGISRRQIASKLLPNILASFHHQIVATTGSQTTQMSGVRQ